MALQMPSSCWTIRLLRIVACLPQCDGSNMEESSCLDCKEDDGKEDDIEGDDNKMDH